MQEHADDKNREVLKLETCLFNRAVVQEGHCMLRISSSLLWNMPTLILRIIYAKHYRGTRKCVFCMYGRSYPILN